MIASTISEQIVTVNESRNYAQEGDVRLLAPGDAGAVAMRQHWRDLDANADQVRVSIVKRAPVNAKTLAWYIALLKWLRSTAAIYSPR
jgi:hypothetical protein